MHQVTLVGVDIATVRGLGSASAWQPRGMAEIDLWVTPAERKQLESLGMKLLPLPDEARAMWEHEQSLPERERDYHNYAALTTLLQAYADAYPAICRLYSIGQSVQGRELWVMKITDNPDLDEDEPEFKYVSTMHGNEPVGTEMCLNLIDDMLVDYGTDPVLTGLVNEVEIHILPMMNPDGNALGQRNNANGVDLNRNFPDPYNSPNNTTVGRQIETAHVMNWTQAKDFDLSANFHTGAVVVNYPFDNNATGQSVYTACPDDDVFIQMSEAYSFQNQPMWNGAFTHGITNGADWYTMSGGMQDWNYRWEGGMEVTVELSNTSWPNASALPQLWIDNRGSMIAYLGWVLHGVRGLVTSATTGLPLPGVEVRVSGRDVATWSAAAVGDYHRILSAGTYSLTFTKPGYTPVTLNNIVVGSGAATVQHVAMQPINPTPDLALGTVTVLDGDNGQLDPGETATLQIEVTNVGTATAESVQGLLSESSPWVTVNSGIQSYGNLLPDQSAMAAFSVTVGADAPVGEAVSFTLAGSFVGGNENLPFTLAIGLIVEDFESGNFLEWPWVMAGNQPWIISSAAQEGLFCARSGNISHSQTSQMALNLNFASAGTVRFMARVSTEDNYDFLRILLDGVEQMSISGSVPWTEYSLPVTAGVHQLRWTYQKDGSVVGGEDAVFVDFIQLPPMAPTPYPDWVVTPAAIQSTLSPGAATVEQILLQNTGAAELTWSATLSLDNPVAMATALPEVKLEKGVADSRSGGLSRDAGGPDAFGHYWMDSREPGGPIFSWVEISGVGTALVSADEQSHGPLNLGFSMPFYGASYSTVRICTNGFLSFTSSATTYTNVDIPNTAAPNALIAPFWDDLSPNQGGTIYYWDDPAADRFIVEYSAVRHYNTTTTETFQVILNGDGSIICQYLSVGLADNCTVGIENATGTDGLRVLFNTNGWLQNNLALRFSMEAPGNPWAFLSPLTGTVPAGGQVLLDLELDATDLLDGIYTGSVDLQSNDPDTPTLTIPLTLTVSSQLDPVDDLQISVAAGQVVLAWSPVPGAAGYKVYKSVTGWSGYALVGSTTETTWSGPATANEAAFYQVTATRP